MRTVQICIYVFIAAMFTACNVKDKSEGFAPEMVKFQPYKGNPVFKATGTNTWDKNIRERGFILLEDNIYKLWYTGYNDSLSEERYLGYATSKDGTHWERYADNPIFKGHWTEDMFVMKNKGKYYMYAEGGVEDIAHFLTSDDGLHWQEQGNLIIITTKGDTIPGPYGTPTALIEDGQWYLFYERDDMGVWLAKSEDKITWTNIQDDPVLPLGPEPYDNGYVAADQVVKYKGNYYMYYHATADRVKQDVWTSNVAISTDLVHWKKYPGNPFIEGDHSSPVLVFDGNKPILYAMHPEVWRYDSE